MAFAKTVAYICATPPQPEPIMEPVGWADMNVRGEDKGLSWTPGYFHTAPLYTTPPQRTPDLSEVKRIAAQLGWKPPSEWQGLTDENIS